MASTSESYRAAADEHLERAQDLFSNESYHLCHYLAGLAVECHLRAHIRARTPVFDARHDLELLALVADFYEVVPLSRHDRFSAVFSDLNRRWRSNHRYFSERQFLDFMNDLRAEYNVKGDRRKNLARTALNHAQAIIKQGEAKWSNE